MRFLGLPKILRFCEKFELVFEAIGQEALKGLLAGSIPCCAILLHGRDDGTNLLVNRSAFFGALESVSFLRILP